MIIARSSISGGADWSLRAGSYAKTSATLKQRAADLAAFESVHGLFPRGVRQEFHYQLKFLQILRDGGEPRLRLFVKMHLNSQYMATVLKSLEREMDRKKGEPKVATPEPPGEKEEAALMKEPPGEVLLLESQANATDWDGVEAEFVSSTRKILSAPLTTPEAFSRALAEELKEEADAEAKEKATAEEEAGSGPPVIKFDASAASAIHQMLCSSSLKVGSSRITLALLAWELDNPGASKLPASLDVLVPAYLPAIPVNPLNGEPIGYEPARRLLTGIWEKTGKDGTETSCREEMTIPPLGR